MIECQAMSKTVNFIVLKSKRSGAHTSFGKYGARCIGFCVYPQRNVLDDLTFCDRDGNMTFGRVVFKGKNL